MITQFTRLSYALGVSVSHIYNINILALDDEINSLNRYLVYQRYYKHSNSNIGTYI